MKIFTIGHSTRKIEEFTEILLEYNIKQVIDVRTIPRSRYNPQYNAESLKNKLAGFGISYIHIAKLGGLRKPLENSINLAWRNLSFRGYSDYMQTDEFWDSISKLIELSKKEITLIMCAESVPWKCHRSLIADALTMNKVDVVHILDKTHSIEHEMTKFAKIVKGKIIYEKS